MAPATRTVDELQLLPRVSRARAQLVHQLLKRRVAHEEGVAVWQQERQPRAAAEGVSEVSRTPVHGPTCEGVPVPACESMPVQLRPEQTGVAVVPTPSVAVQVELAALLLAVSVAVTFDA